MPVTEAKRRTKTTGTMRASEANESAPERHSRQAMGPSNWPRPQQGPARRRRQPEKSRLQAEGHHLRQRRLQVRRTSKWVF